MYLSLNRLTNKYGKRIVLIFLYPMYKAPSMSESYFCQPLFLFSLVCNATNFFICSLNRWKKASYALLVFFNWVAFLFLVYADIPFKRLQTGLRRKPFWFLCKINNFQNQNTYERNFKVIINISRLFNSNMRISTYLDQTRTIK